MRRLLALALALATLSAAAGCSIPTDESAQVIDPEQLPDVLRSTTTTSTTSVPPSPGNTVDYFLIQQLDRKVLVPVEWEVDSREPVDILTPLFDGSLQPGEGFINNLLEYELARVSGPDDSDIATVELTTINPDAPPSQDIFRDAVAQLVWTLTRNTTVEELIILRDGQEPTLPTNSTEEIGDVEPGTPVGVEFYDRYDPEAPAPTTTTTTTSETTTSAPRGP